MKLEDKISIALVGAIGAGKKILQEKAEQHHEILFQALQGNFWVPHRLTSIREKMDEELLKKYSQNPSSYAFEFQNRRLAERLRQQRQVENSSGLVFLGEPLEVDRWVYAEANKNLIGEAFSTYELLYNEVNMRVRSIDVLIYLRIKEDEVSVLQERIKKEGKSEEQKFVTDPSYLLKLIQFHEERFHEEKHKPVIEIDATHKALGGAWDENYFQEIFALIAEKVREFNKPPRFSLVEWKAVDYNRAKNAAREARRQLRQYLKNHQRIITFAGLVSTGKTGLAEMISGELEIDIMRELKDKNDEIGDDLLRKFLLDKKNYCYHLQKHLIPKRTEARKKFYSWGKSFVEDRSPVEDQSIFWRRFKEQGYLTDEQMAELKELAKETYAKAPKSDLIIKLKRDPRQCRTMVLERGRPEEIQAWPEDELIAMNGFYQDFFEDLEQYGSHQGPKLELNLEKVDPDKGIHQGYIFQEMLHSLLDFEKKERHRAHK